MMWIIYPILYFLFLLFLYLFIIKRLKQLSLGHEENTWIKSLRYWYRIVRIRMMILFIILFFLGSLVLLTMVDNELFYKVWLRNDQKTLDSAPF